MKAFEEPQSERKEEAAVPYNPVPQAPRTPIEGVIQRHRDSLVAIDGVVGVGHGQTGIGRSAVMLYALKASVADRAPKELEGYPVEVVVVPGGFVAQRTSR